MSSKQAVDTTSAAASRTLALQSRSASRALLTLGYEGRCAILRSIAEALIDQNNVKRILEANVVDVEAAKSAGMTPSNFARLSLTASKLSTLASGLRQLSDSAFVADPVNKIIKRTQLADGLMLQQKTVPLGVLLVIFESRPDVLPQLIGLAVLSSNGLLLKGGSESRHTLSVLYSLCTDAITSASQGKVNGSHLVALLSGRDAVTSLLALDDCIDLVIPRGGNALVSHVKANTKIPVLGHADGVCHIYLDNDYGGQSSLLNMIEIIVDSKTDYPAACNAVETLLIHEDVVHHTGLASGQNAAESIVLALKAAGVTIKVGPRALAHAQARPKSSPFRDLHPAESLHTEYGDLTICVELVPGMTEAIQHIHTHGSSHTECILTANAQTASQFLQNVDSACVFHNASTRFADGYRLGLGAEVGISTSRIHARGPVGVEGLCSTKWVLVSDKPQGQPVKPFQTGQLKYLHKQLPVPSKL